MINYLLLMLIPVIVAIGTIVWFRGKITGSEIALQLAVPAILLAAGMSFSYCNSVADYELWNGRVIDKKSQRESCDHSYSCNCFTTCDSKGSCQTICQTCYEHSYDVSWYVGAATNGNIGEWVEIDRVDRQGLKMPPRWGAAFIGEPFSSSHSYDNYLLVNPESVLHGGKGDVEKFKALLPEYPQLYDYYRTQHVLNAGVPGITKDWEWLLDEVNGDVGPVKNVNILLVLTKTADPTYTLALRTKWIGGKKNDVIVVIGSPDGKRIAFSDVVSWSPAQAFQIRLKDRIFQVGTLEKRDEIAKAIREEVSGGYKAMDIKQYKYLMSSYELSGTAMATLLSIGVLVSLGLAIWAVGNDIQQPRSSW
jgi:hypothetical protein